MALFHFAISRTVCRNGEIDFEAGTLCGLGRLILAADDPDDDFPGYVGGEERRPYAGISQFIRFLAHHENTPYTICSSCEVLYSIAVANRIPLRHHQLEARVLALLKKAEAA